MEKVAYGRKRTVFEAFIKQKCPKCRQGEMFPYATYNISRFYLDNKNCPVCGLKYEVEPGFFTGAMYFSYAINVAIIVVLGVALNLLTDLSIYTVITIVIAGVLIAVPMTFRYSRMLMMYLFSGIDFDENTKLNKE